MSESIRQLLASQQRQIDYLRDAARQLSATLELLGPQRLTDHFFEYLRTLRPAEWLLRGGSRSAAGGSCRVWGKDLMDELGTATDNVRRGRVGTIITRYYTSAHPHQLSSLVWNWDLKEFRENGRPELFRQALRAHRRGDYAVATLVLTMQIEGVVKDFLFREQFITVDVQRNGKSPVPLLKAHLATEKEPHFSGFVDDLERMYARYTGPQARRRAPNRHGQAHGGEAPANSAQETVRAFLRLQTLHFHLAAIRRRRRKKVA